MNTLKSSSYPLAPIAVCALLVAGSLFWLANQRQGNSPVVGTTKSSSVVIHNLSGDEIFELSAAPIKHSIGGVENSMMAYNGSIPGPVLRVKQGEKIKVRFTNNLSESTTVHWHGVRVKNANDGVSDVTQKPVPPGGTFTYELRFPDAGAYWYHPHVREDKQQDLGLYGSIIVTPAAEGYWPNAAKEEVVMIDDIISSRGFIAPYFEDLVDHALMGRYGNVMLVNGIEQPEFTAEAGRPNRYYLTNVANARPFNIVIPGAELTLIGSDGGRVQTPVGINSVLLSPSERAVVQVVFPKSGTYTMEHRTPDRTYKLASINVAGSANVSTIKIPDLNSNDFSDITRQLGKPVDVSWRLDVQTAHMMHHADSPHDIEWEDNMAMMNAHMTDKTTQWKIVDAATGKENMNIHAEWKTGSFVKIRIINAENSDHPMQHPIHLHGQRFVVSAVNGAKNEKLEWKDTVLVPKGTTTDIVVEISNPGEWMAHCHIAEHLQSGMMTMFTAKGEDLVE